ncbi:hypothetical protein D5278_06650 [bacterium 1XD21-13]|nr:hypothetical protein [bacterium 1XD21-13]
MKAGTVLQILYENTKEPINQVQISLPVSSVHKMKLEMLRLTSGHMEGTVTFRIAKADSVIDNLHQYLTADMSLEKLNQLAEKIAGMEREEQNKFSGVLDCRSISEIDDLLEAADSLELYEYLPGVTCSQQLGGYLVENGIWKFPRETWPYLNYRGIGEEFYANHSCTYTASGLVIRKEEGVRMEEKKGPEFSM